MRLRMTEKAARQLGRLPKTPEEQKAAEEAAAKARAEEAARREEEKRRREAEQEGLRQKIKQEISDAQESEVKLRSAIEEYNAAADSTVEDRHALKGLQANLKEAEVRRDDAARALAKAREHFEAAQAELQSAFVAYDDVKGRVEQANEVLATKRRNVTDALVMSNHAWDKLTKQRRKELRDRALKKNAARIAGVSEVE